MTLVAPGEWALVTGASSGIGARLAARLLERGIPTFLVARTAAPMEALAARFAGRVPCEVLTADLSREGAAADLFARSEGAGKPIGLLVNDAGFGWNGEFDAQPAELLAAMLAVNVLAPATLTRAFLPAMRARRRGRILNVASTAAFLPNPYFGAYSASKAFLLSLSLALREEVAKDGIGVTCLCPGVTRTPFFEPAGMDEKKLRAFGLLDPDTVAERGLRALEKGTAVSVTSPRDRIWIALLRLVPRGLPPKVAAALFARSSVKNPC